MKYSRGYIVGLLAQVGIQVGLLAPEYHCKTVDGDTLTSSQFKNTVVLIANVSGCTTSSFKHFKELVKTYGSNLKIIGLNTNVNKDLGDNMVDVNDIYNQDILTNFRKYYGTFDCFLINEEG